MCHRSFSLVSDNDKAHNWQFYIIYDVECSVMFFQSAVFRPKRQRAQLILAPLKCDKQRKEYPFCKRHRRCCMSKKLPFPRFCAHRCIASHVESDPPPPGQFCSGFFFFLLFFFYNVNYFINPCHSWFINPTKK